MIITEMMIARLHHHICTSAGTRDEAWVGLAYALHEPSNEPGSRLANGVDSNKYCVQPCIMRVYTDGMQSEVKMESDFSSLK